MSELKIPKINVIIRPTVKTLEEMSFKCPINWNIRLIRTIVFEQHHSLRVVYSLDKLAIVYRGRRLDDNEIVEDLWQQAGSPDLVVFFLQILLPGATGQTQQSKQAEAETKNEIKDCEQEIKALLTEKSLLKDYLRKAQFLVPDGFESESNIRNLSFINSLPIMSGEFTQKIKKVSRRIEENEKFGSFGKSGTGGSEPQNPSAANNAVQANQNQLGDRFHHWKLLAKITAFYLLFGNYFKGPHMIMLGIILFYYYRIELKENERRNRVTNPDPNADKEGNNDKPRKRKPSWLNVNIMKTSQMFSCFFLSLFPSWSVDLFLDSESVKKEVEEIMLYYGGDKKTAETGEIPASKEENKGGNEANEEGQPQISEQLNGSESQREELHEQGASDRNNKDNRREREKQSSREDHLPHFLNSIIGDDTIDAHALKEHLSKSKRAKQGKRSEPPKVTNTEEKNEQSEGEWVDEEDLVEEEKQAHIRRKMK